MRLKFGHKMLSKEPKCQAKENAFRASIELGEKIGKTDPIQKNAPNHKDNVKCGTTKTNFCVNRRPRN
jgi:hypothetical protein